VTGKMLANLANGVQTWTQTYNYCVIENEILVKLFLNLLVLVDDGP